MKQLRLAASSWCPRRTVQLVPHSTHSPTSAASRLVAYVMGTDEIRFWPTIKFGALDYCLEKSPALPWAGYLYTFLFFFTNTMLVPCQTCLLEAKLG